MCHKTCMDKKHFNGVCETFAENTCCQVKHETCVILLHVPATAACLIFETCVTKHV